MKTVAKIFAVPAALVLLALPSCGGGSSPFNADDLNSNQTYLYVASGPCYGGGVTVSTGPANVVSKFNTTTGSFVSTVIDYNQLSPGDSPVSITDYDSAHLLVLVENAGGRRIDLVNKDGSGFQTYLINTTALNGVTRAMTLLSDFSLLVSKSSAVEKFTSGKARVLEGVNPFINAPASTCATSTTLISSMAVDPKTGKVLYTHAAATTNNKTGVINSTGYNVAGDCLSATTAPTTLALPTRVIFHSSGKVLISYGSTTATSNFIYSYDFNGTTGVLSNPVAVFNDGGVIVNGPSVIIENPATTDVFVANAMSTYNTIEKFHFANNALTRATSGTFIPSLAQTRCVSDMKVMN